MNKERIEWLVSKAQSFVMAIEGGVVTRTVRKQLAEEFELRESSGFPVVDPDTGKPYFPTKVGIKPKGWFPDVAEYNYSGTWEDFSREQILSMLKGEYVELKPEIA